MQNKTIADYNELDCLRAIVAAQQALLDAYTTGVPVIADGVYDLSDTLGGTITFQRGLVTAFTPAS